MEVIEIITAFVLSLSFLLLIWAIKGFLLRPTICGKSSKSTIVLTADEKTRDLERVIESLRWLKQNGQLNADILIVDVGMEYETAEIALSLSRRDSSIRVCSPDEIANIITRGTANGAKR